MRLVIKNIHQLAYCELDDSGPPIVARCGVREKKGGAVKIAMIEAALRGDFFLNPCSIVKLKTFTLQGFIPVKRSKHLFNAE